MATVKRRGPGWQATFRAPDGRERTRTFPRKVDAENWAADERSRMTRGIWVDPRAGKVSFRNYAESWIATKVDVSPRTRINVETRLNRHATPYFNNRPMNSIRPSDVRSFVAKLTGELKLAPSTVKAIYLTTAQVFAQAVTDHEIAVNPCAGVTLPRERQHEEMHFLTPEQVNELADAITERHRTLIYAAAYGGLRAGELVALKVERVDILKCEIRVESAASEVRGKLEFGPTKTGKVRTVAIPRFLAQMLGEHIGTYPSRDGFVFTAAEGGPLRHRNFYQRHYQPAVRKARAKAIKEDRDQAIPEDLRFHDLRHTCAAILIADGRHMEEVKDHLGHSSIRVTSDRYGHLFPKARKALAEGLEAVYQGAATEAPADITRTNAEILEFPSAKSEAN